MRAVFVLLLLMLYAASGFTFLPRVGNCVWNLRVRRCEVLEKAKQVRQLVRR